MMYLLLYYLLHFWDLKKGGGLSAVKLIYVPVSIIVGIIAGLIVGIYFSEIF